MLFDLKQAHGADKIILQAVKMRKPIPKKFADAPMLFPWLQVFYVAFDDLIADRNWPDGPITWLARQKWAEAHGLDDVATHLLHTHLKAMDLAFLKLKRDNTPTDRDQGNRTDGVISRLGPGHEKPVR